MRGGTVLVLSWVAVVGVAQAKMLPRIPADGNPFSSFSKIVDVRQVQTETDVLRLYHVALSETETALILQIMADNRPPSSSKASSSMSWKLAAPLEAVEALFASEDVVTIRGRDKSGKSLTCKLKVRFDQGVLSSQLDDQGCTE